MSDTYDFVGLSLNAKQALSSEFPGSAVSVDEGWHGRVHMKIVSDIFNGKSEAVKQEIVWNVLREKLGADAQGVSLVLAYGFDEL
jgi:stress-induced morphogen